MINRSKVRGLMAEKNIKQVDMAKFLGISRNSFSMKLNEKSTFDEKEVCGIAKKLNVEVSFLFV